MRLFASLQNTRPPFLFEGYDKMSQAFSLASYVEMQTEEVHALLFYWYVAAPERPSLHYVLRISSRLGLLRTSSTTTLALE